MAYREISTRVGPVPVRVLGEGEPVLAVHGLLVNGRLWDGVAEQLAGGVRLVVPDLPLGAHRRPVPDRTRLTPYGLADALVDLLDGLGIERAVLVGNDTGGALTQLAATRHPDRVRGLVLAGCDAFEHFPPAVLRPVLAAARVPVLARLLVAALAVPALLADPGPLNLFSTRGLGRDRVAEALAPARLDPAVRADVVALIRAVHPEPLLAAAPDLAHHAGRAAVVWSRRDRFFPPQDAERLAALLGTEVSWLDDALTFVPVDRPDAVADAVRRVLATTAVRS